MSNIFYRISAVFNGPVVKGGNHAALRRVPVLSRHSPTPWHCCPTHLHLRHKCRCHPADTCATPPWRCPPHTIPVFFRGRPGVLPGGHVCGFQQVLVWSRVLNGDVLTGGAPFLFYANTCKVNSNIDIRRSFPVRDREMG